MNSNPVFFIIFCSHNLIFGVRNILGFTSAEYKFLKPLIYGGLHTCSVHLFLLDMGCLILSHPVSSTTYITQPKPTDRDSRAGDNEYQIQIKFNKLPTTVLVHTPVCT